jgi:hypothetical protein
MKIISLASNIAGPACAISVSIKKYFYNDNYKTNIFDYLEISLKSINQILEIISKKEDIEILLKTKNKKYLNNDGNISVIFNNFDKIISHHDLNNEFSENDYIEFIDKYIRRYDRLIMDLYKEDKIFFIRFGKEEKEDIINFIKNINTINPLLKIYFIHLDYNNYENNDDYSYKLDYQYEKKENILKINYNYINFYDYVNLDKKYSENLFYKTIEFDWNIVYQYIRSIINEREKKDFIFYN